jgi:hypothetical protein
MGSRFQGYFLLAVYPKLNFKKVEQIALHSTLIFFCRVNKTQEGVRLCWGEGGGFVFPLGTSSMAF